MLGDVVNKLGLSWAKLTPLDWSKIRHKNLRLEAKIDKSRTTLFSQNFKVRENKVSLKGPLSFIFTFGL